MWKRLGVPLAVLPLSACLWLSRGPEARPRLGLESVERTPPAAAGARLQPVAEPGVRGWMFADSLIVFRTRTGASSVRVRVWNRSAVPVQVSWDSVAGAAGRGGSDGCPEFAERWMLRDRDGALPPYTLAPGASWEKVVEPAALGAGPGQVWRMVSLPCLVFDPAQPRAALRLWVQAGPRRYGYTFWYRLMEPPREDAVEAAGAQGSAAVRAHRQEPVDACKAEAPMTSQITPGNKLDALPAPVEHKAPEPVAGAPLPPPAHAPGARAGWPAEDHLPGEEEDGEC